ncbi:uncharacterized protein DS421_17g599900 [Arachis hypogaea]|nr:uncharacterized protein DS421_17g599900 [Arachis hypogaea]
MSPYGETNEKWSMKERLKTPVENEELNFVLEQVEKAEIIEEEEVVEDLGDVEPPWESQVIEPPSKKFEFDVEEGTQPPKHVMNEELEDMDSIIEEFLSTIESSLIGHEIEAKEEDTQTPIPLVSNEEEIKLEESYQEEDVEIEEACQEVEVVKKEHKGVKHTLSKPLETTLPKSPSNTIFKWVKFLFLSFTFPLEYGLLEMDGQLRALCGIKSKREMVSGWKYKPRFVMVERSKLNCKGWNQARLFRSRKLFGCLSENLDCLPPGWNNDDQLEDGCRNKI